MRSTLKPVVDPAIVFYEIHPPRMAHRLVALDTFRGMSIAAMILINNPGSPTRSYHLLQHATWNGCRLADLIFPFFLFIVGVSIPLSFAANAARAGGRTRVHVRILRRTALLFLVGLALNGFPNFDWESMRIPGVLQRIALCYGAAAILSRTTGWRGQLLTAGVLLAGYAASMALVPVPEIGPGHLDPGADLAAYVDRLVLSGHMMYEDWDPEGLLGTLPAIATTVIGVLAGQWILGARAPKRRAAGLALGGLAVLAAGVVLTGWVPLNKSLWSSSYALYTSGCAALLLAACEWVIDIEGWHGWTTPFVAYGVNPITAYVLSTLMTKVLLLGQVQMADGSVVHLQQWLFERFFLPAGSPEFASFLYAFANVMIWLGVVSALYRRKIYIRL